MMVYLGWAAVGTKRSTEIATRAWGRWAGLQRYTESFRQTPKLLCAGGGGGIRTPAGAKSLCKRLPAQESKNHREVIYLTEKVQRSKA